MIKNWRSVILWIVLSVCFIVSRILILYSPPLYEGMPARVQPDLEEFFIGNIATEIIRGPIDPISHLKDRPYENYMLINGILVVPFFVLLGESYAALKMTALLFSLGTLIIMIIFAGRNFGPVTAFIMFLLLFFPPTGVLRFSLWAVGHFPQSPLITFLILLCYFPLIFPPEQQKRPSYWRIALSGLLCGFGLYFHPFLAITVAYCIVLAFCFRQELFKIKWSGLFLLMLVLGAGVIQTRSLFSLYNNIYFREKVVFLSVENVRSIIPRLRILFDNFLWQIWNYSDVSIRYGPLINKSFYGLSAIAYFALCFRVCKKGISPGDDNLRKKLLAILLFAPLFVCIFAVSHLSDIWNQAGMRYLNVLVPFIFLYLALFISGMTARTRPVVIKALGILIIGAVMAANVKGFASMVGPLGEGRWAMRAVWMSVLGNFIGRNHLGEDPNPVLRRIAHEREGEDETEMTRGFLDTQISALGRDNQIVEKAIGYIRSVDEAYQPESCLSLGMLLANMNLDKPSEGIGIQLLKQVPPEFVSHVARGMGSTLGWRLIARYPDQNRERFQRFEEIASSVNPGLRQELYFGLGSVLVWKYEMKAFERQERNEARLQNFAQFVPDDVRDSFIRGKEGDWYYRFGEF